MEKVVRIWSGWVTPKPPYMAGVQMAFVDHILKDECDVRAVLAEMKLKRRV